MSISNRSLADAMDFAKIAIEDASKIVIDRVEYVRIPHVNDSASSSSSLTSASMNRKKLKIDENNDFDINQMGSGISHCCSNDQCVDYKWMGEFNDDSVIDMLKDRELEINDLKMSLKLLILRFRN